MILGCFDMYMIAVLLHGMFSFARYGLVYKTLKSALQGTCQGLVRRYSRSAGKGDAEDRLEHLPHDLRSEPNGI